MISQNLLDIIACPQCKGAVQLTEMQDSLVCPTCQLLYAIRDGIPIMLLDEAKPLEYLRSSPNQY
ncbi:Trm112 family protein [Candidatus Electronema sp. PJ]|uniref:Trm112 family protein n=1 Tax=Candidatus Electronema sp. PJ TaxID=3401572 RepID=UPI003AA937B9